MSESLASLRQGDSKAFFAFDEEPNKDITCAICFEPWQHPVELLPCGHIFCESCLPSGSNRCPMCRVLATSHTIPNRALMNVVSSLPVSCTRCEWKGEYCEFQRHDCPAGNDHQLPRHKESPTTATTGTNEQTEMQPLLVNTDGEEEPLSRSDRMWAFVRKHFLTILIVFCVLLIPIGMFASGWEYNHHDDSKSPVPMAPPVPPTQAPSPMAPWICSSRMCVDLPWYAQNECHSDEAPHPASIFECIEHPKECASTPSIKNCSHVCNRVTCQYNWRQCSAEACMHFGRLPLCSDEKMFRCYDGPMKGSCSDAPDISNCDKICDIRTCVPPS